MPTRNIRPRVLTAINELRTFTVAELCHTARLADRDQAYNQIHRLKSEGFLIQRTVPAGKRHAPFKEYSLISDPLKREEFATELANYRPERPTAPPNQAISTLGQLTLEEALREIDEIERSVGRLETLPTAAGEQELAALETRLQSAWTNIETARLEQEDAGVGEQAQLREAEERWRNAEKKFLALKLAQTRQPLPDWSLLLRTAAQAVKTVITPQGLATSVGFAAPATLAGSIRGLSIHSAYRAAKEVLLDEIQADERRPFVPMFLQALRIGDAPLVLEILTMFRETNLAWWDYNLENTNYLATANLRIDNWLAAYAALRPRIDCLRERPIQAYSCSPQSLTRDLYLNVTKGQQVSFISPGEIAFLGAPEKVYPTLLVERGDTLKALDCSFLKPQGAILNAYGPLANDVDCWQGAPDLRVAACLGMWGLPLEKRLPAIAKSLQGDRGILVLQGDDPGLTTDQIRQLDAQAIA